MTRAFIQARMSSLRFPGKVLAPFRGRPIIAHVVAQVAQVLAIGQLTIVTSTEESDDPLACYVRQMGVSLYRGALDDVFERFRGSLEIYPCDWILRVSADSPLLNTRVLRQVVQAQSLQQYDLITTIFPRTFPKGQNAELIRVSSFLDVDQQALSPDDREHITSFFYRHPSRFRILNIESEEPVRAESVAVDTLEDLQRLEQLAEEDLRRFTGYEPVTLPTPAGSE